MKQSCQAPQISQDARIEQVWYEGIMNHVSNDLQDYSVLVPGRYDTKVGCNGDRWELLVEELSRLLGSPLVDQVHEGGHLAAVFLNGGNWVDRSVLDR